MKNKIKFKINEIARAKKNPEKKLHIFLEPQKQFDNKNRP